MVNLDPAADHFSYTPSIDIRELISLSDVMSELQYGPNGGLVYALEYLASHLSFLSHQLDDYSDDYLIIDCIAEGSLISLADGTSLPIERVGAGRRVLTRHFAESDSEEEEDGLVALPVLSATDKGMRPCMELLFSDGRTLTCTPDHRLLTADGRWVKAAELVVGTSQVAAGVECPLVNRHGCNGWTLDLSGTLGYALDMGTRVEHSLAFARLLGYLLTDGCKWSQDTELYLGHALDAEAVLTDVRLLSGISPVVGMQPNGVRRICLPRILHRAFDAVGVAAGRRVAKLTAFPAFVRTPGCPVPVVQEFLGGLFGGDGTTILLAHQGGGHFSGLGFTLTRTGAVIEQQQQQLMDELLPLLATAAGIAAAHITMFFASTGPCTRIESGKRELEELQAEGVTVRGVVAAVDLEAETHYELRLRISAEAVTAFARGIGFRYCCHKTQRLTAAVAYYRGQELWARQRQQLNARILALRRTHTIPAATRVAKQEIGQREQLLPDLAQWAPKQEDQLRRGAKRQGKGASSLMSQLKAMDTFRFFSEPRTKEPYDSAQRRGEIERERANSVSSNSSSSSLSSAVGSSWATASPLSSSGSRIGCSPLSSSIGSSSSSSPSISWSSGGGKPPSRMSDGDVEEEELEEYDEKKASPVAAEAYDENKAEEKADKVRYGVHKKAQSLPLYRVQLVGRREVGVKHVYDLAVPNPQGDESRSFVANGLVVHNCPGQIELYSHLPVMPAIARFLEREGYRVCALYCIDALFLSDTRRFISGVMMALSAMMQLELPHVSVLTKCDTLHDRSIIDKYCDPDMTVVLAELAEEGGGAEGGAEQRPYSRLNAAIALLLEQYSMVSFVPLDLTDEDSIDELLQHADNAMQYGEDVEPQEPQDEQEVDIDQWQQH